MSDEEKLNNSENEQNEEAQEQSAEENAPMSENVEKSAEELQKLLEQEKELSKGYLDRLRRNMAEFDNYRKRTTAEKAGMYDNGVSDAVMELLPVIDNFERALNAAGTEKDGSLYKGVELIFKQLSDAFTSLGVEEISETTFDPNIHNAVMHIEDESFGESEIAEVLLKGYRYKDKVIRPSMVKVAN